MYVSFLIVQIIYITNVADPDLDGYVHFVAGRLLSVDAMNLSTHWVWLPLYHYVLVLFIKAGAGFTAVRFFSVLCWMLVVYLTGKLLEQKRITGEGKLNNKKVWLTALLFFMPTAFLSASSAEPEAFFTLLIISGVYLAMQDKYLLASIPFGAACLVRYEAAAMLAGICIYFILTVPAFSGKIKQTAEISFLPILMIFLWLYMRYAYQNEAFSFISRTKQFADTYTDVRPEYFMQAVQVLFDASFYILYIPLLAGGLFLIFAYRGFISAMRKYSLLGFASLSCLLFISLAWWLRYSLGLYRHFTVLLPFFALCIKEGVSGCIDRSIPGKSRRKKVVTAVVITHILLIIFALGIWEKHTETVMSDSMQIIEKVNALPDNARILCAENRVEVLSNKPSSSFERLWIDTSRYSAEKLTNFIETVHNGYFIMNKEMYNFYVFQLWGKINLIRETGNADLKKRLVLLQSK